MTFERSPGPPAEPGPTPVVGGSSAEPTPVQIRLQIMSTEHWSLLASRSLAWNESFTRAGMFLSTLTGSIVALSLIGGVAGFDDPFYVVALVLLPVDLFVGIGTWFRMGDANYHDAITVAGMNRIRAGYLEIAPDLERFFVMGVHDDARGIGITMAVPPGTSAAAHLISGTPTLVMVLNGIISGAIAAIVLLRLVDADPRVALAAALFVAVLVVFIEFASARRKIRRAQHARESIFPSPPGPRGPAEL